MERLAMVLVAVLVAGCAGEPPPWIGTYRAEPNEYYSSEIEFSEDGVCVHDLKVEEELYGTVKCSYTPPDSAGKTVLTTVWAGEDSTVQVTGRWQKEWMVFRHDGGAPMFRVLPDTDRAALLALSAAKREVAAEEETKERPQRAMKSDLRNLATAQEIYYSDDNRFSYTRNRQRLEFIPSPGVAIRIMEATSTGWSAVATYEGETATCAIYYGDAAMAEPATVPGVVTCADSLP